MKFGIFVEFAFGHIWQGKGKAMLFLSNARQPLLFALVLAANVFIFAKFLTFFAQKFNQNHGARMQKVYFR